jgi:inner membrane protein
MDNLTHAALGLSAGLLVARRGGSLPAAAVAALLAAEAPDLDVFIRNGDDPLVSFRWHRHFTHSFIFMPIWALASAWLTSWLFRWRQKGEEPWRGLFLPAFAGVLTHLLCDGCTSYGTMLLWPFNEMRYAWDCLPIVDLFATLPLLTLVILAYRRQSRRLAAYGLIWFTGYAFIGVWQHHRAEASLRASLSARGIEPTRLTVKPTVSNLIVWRGIWQHKDHWQVGAVRVPPWGEAMVAPGDERLVWKETMPGNPPADSKAGRHFADFSKFTQGWNTYAAFESGVVVGDVRFGMLPTSGRPLWSVYFGRDTKHGSNNSTVEILMDRTLEDGDWGRFWGLLNGSDPRYVPVR